MDGADIGDGTVILRIPDRLADDLRCGRHHQIHPDQRRCRHPAHHFC
ncbi:hypothetical protein I7I51_00671 [Histoplasma capsulatum]|uniref:Uncharacterized protein n=1 Tax=Ajellomyces capsulatus TaxID=5037 RepID=A0A8A1MGC3_AJECA|nr:hypothetical protein I7I51_00671 [Histoplasma capsulatum]